MASRTLRVVEDPTEEDALAHGVAAAIQRCAVAERAARIAHERAHANLVEALLAGQRHGFPIRELSRFTEVGGHRMPTSTVQARIRERRSQR